MIQLHVNSNAGPYSTSAGYAYRRQVVYYNLERIPGKLTISLGILTQR